MTDVERVVREALTDRAERVRACTTDPLPGVQRRAGKIRYRRTLATAAPAIAGFAAAATFVAVVERGDGSGVTVTPAETESATSMVSPTPPTPTPSTGSPEPSATSKATPRTTVTLVPRTREEALAWGLAVHPDVIQDVTYGSKPQGRLQCGLKILGESPAKGEVYAWILCQDFFEEQGQVKLGAGASVPAVIHVAGSEADTSITKVVFPSQPTLAEDIRRLFPTKLQDAVTMGNIRVSPDMEELRAQAERDLAGQVTYQVPAPPAT